MLAVGKGKTVISMLAPTVFEARKAVLLVQPQLRNQLVLKDMPFWSKHFRIDPSRIEVVSYSKLSRVDGADLLEKIQPDLIVADEAQALKASTAARTKRFKRFMHAHPETRLVALSGTLTSKSLKDYYHLCEMALGTEQSPLPTFWPVLVEWAQALDPVKEGHEDDVLAVGCLEQLCNAGETARDGFQRRLRETLGVVATSDNDLGISLNIRKREYKPPYVMLAALSNLKSTWALPEGEELEDALAFSRAARQLSCGFYYRWVWPNGQADNEWLDARRAWHREMRQYLSHHARPGMDSPLLLARAAASGKWDSCCWPDWCAVKDRPMPPTEAVWVTDDFVKDVVEWGKKNVGVIWYESSSLGDAIAKASGFPLYGPGEEASRKILDEDGSRTIVASVLAHGTGKNLQMFNKNLVTQPSSSGATWEQLLGRTHRPGQEADEVWVDYYEHEAFDVAVTNAQRDAAYIFETTGQKQKLLQATFVEVE